MALLSDGKRSRAIAKSGAIMWRSCTSPGVTTILISRPIASTAVWRFLPLIFLPASYPAESIFAPLFLHSSRSGYRRLPALESLTCPLTPAPRHGAHASALKLDKVVVRRALGRKILRQLTPLATGGEHVQNAVDERAA